MYHIHQKYIHTHVEKYADRSTEFTLPNCFLQIESSSGTDTHDRLAHPVSEHFLQFVDGQVLTRPPALRPGNPATLESAFVAQKCVFSESSIFELLRIERQFQPPAKRDSGN